MVSGNAVSWKHCFFVPAGPAKKKDELEREREAALPVPQTQPWSDRRWLVTGHEFKSDVATPSSFERAFEIHSCHHLEVKYDLQKSLILVNECIKLQTMHFPRVMFILCQIQGNSFHRDLSQPRIIRNKLESVSWWGWGTPIHLFF